MVHVICWHSLIGLVAHDILISVHFASSKLDEQSPMKSARRLVRITPESDASAQLKSRRLELEADKWVMREGDAEAAFHLMLIIFLRIQRVYACAVSARRSQCAAALLRCFAKFSLSFSNARLSDEMSLGRDACAHTDSRMLPSRSPSASVCEFKEKRATEKSDDCWHGFVCFGREFST